MISQNVLNKIAEREKMTEELKILSTTEYSEDGAIKLFRYSSNTSTQISFIVELLENLHDEDINLFSSPSNEPINVYLNKCISNASLRAEGEIIDPVYQYEVFIVWAENIIKSNLIIKYKAYQLGKLISLISKKEKIEYDELTQKFIDNWANDLGYDYDSIESDIDEFNKNKDNTWSTFAPTSESIEKYLKNVKLYGTFNESKREKSTIYSPLIFAVWIKDQFIINGLDSNEIQGIQSRYFSVKLVNNVDILEDAEKAILLYKKGTIKNNSYNFHFLYYPTQLISSAIYNLKSLIEPIYALIGNILLENGDLENAEYFFSQSLLINPDYISGYDGLADAYRYMHKYNHSIIQSEKGLEILDKYKNIKNKPWFFQVLTEYNSKYAECYYNIAISSAYNKDFDKALKYIDKAIELNTGFFGQKRDKFNSLGSVKGYINHLFNQFENNITIDSSNLSISHPKIREIVEGLFKENQLITSIPYLRHFTKESKNILENIFAFETISGFLEVKDYSIFTNQYFKVLEIELHDKILKKIESWISQNSVQDIGLRIDIFINQRFNKPTLGSYRFILFEEKINKFLQKNFSNNYSFVCTELLKKIDDLLEIRNGSAHRSLTSLEKYSQIKNTFFEQGLLRKIITL